MRKRIRHWFQLGLAWLVIFLGIILLLSPIPIGIFVIALGLSLLIYTSDTVTQNISNFRHRHPKLDSRLIWVEQKLHKKITFISEALIKTRPPR